MKRETYSSDGDEQPVKRKREVYCTALLSLSIPQQECTQPQEPLSPLSEDLANKRAAKSEPDHTPVAPCLSKSASRFERRIFNWIPRPPEEAGEFVEIMTRPTSKKARTASTGTNVLPRDPKAAYKDTGYVTGLNSKGCFMKKSVAGPVPDDIARCGRLIQESQSFQAPQGTLFEDGAIDILHEGVSQNHSEAQLLSELHPFIMPSLSTLSMRGDDTLKDVIDGYNQSWIKTDPIHGPKPQPDHARALQLSAFSDIQQRKLGIKTRKSSLYAVRENMLFPYLTAEVKSGTEGLEYAGRANMHSMCIALRAVVSLAQAAGCPEKVHRKLLAFSISHNLEDVLIYGYYPEIDENGVKYFRWPVHRFYIWMEQKWTCYRFVENLNREFLPIHIDRLKNMLEKIPEPEDNAMEVAPDDYEDPDDYDYYSTRSHSQVSGVRPRELYPYPRTPSSQNGGLQQELHNALAGFQQKIDQQEAKHLAELERRNAREEKLFAELAQLKEFMMGQGSNSK